MIVYLSKSEMAKAEQSAKLRWQLARASGVENKKIDKTRSDQDIDLLGICAEIAFSKLFDVDFNASALGIDSGGDVYIPCGDSEMCVQIKSTFHKSGNLLLTNHDKMNWDIAVLVTKCEISNAFNVVGFISDEKAKKVEVKKDLGHGSGRFIDKSELSDMSILWTFLMKKKHEGSSR